MNIDVPKCMLIRIIEGLLVGNNIGVPDGCQYSDLIDGIMNLFLRFVVEFDHLKSIYALILDSPNFIDVGREGGQNLKLLQGHCYFINIIRIIIYFTSFFLFFLLLLFLLVLLFLLALLL